MPPIKTQVSCPQCRLPVPVTLEQLFDVSQDPEAKRRFLSGQFNRINCPNCRFQGQAASLLLYHDAEKEILMSYVPIELGLPQPEQERAIGRLMNEVINTLPMEKRKGYLLNPKPAFTVQGMIDRIYEADGVSKEQLDAQRGRAQLLQRLLAAPSEDALTALIKDNDAQIDEQLFQILSASIQANAANGNEAAAQRMAAVQNKMAEVSSFGATLRRRQQSVEAAVRELQALGDKLTPDKLMELILKADDDEKVAAYVSLARPAIDYAFFESLTRRIDRTTGPEKERLTRRRDMILQLTQEIDQAAQARVAEASQVLRKILEAPDLNQALAENVQFIDDTFMAVLNENLNAAQRASRPDVVTRLSAIGDAINQMVQASAPPEIRFINELLDLPSHEAAEAELKRRMNEATPEFMASLNYLVDNLRQGGREELAERLDHLRGVVLGEQMAANWKKQ